jgi:probable addiction module antidote protein
MPKRTTPFAPWLAAKLKDPAAAANLLRASLDTPEDFLNALRKIAEAHQVSKVAKSAGRQRESVYRMLSKKGNPRLDSLWSLLRVMGLRLDVALLSKPESSPLRRARKRQTVPVKMTASKKTHRRERASEGVRAEV